MEEAEKRRERLKAMRMEASSDSISQTLQTSPNPNPNPNPNPLWNPLAENLQQLPPPPPPTRFDFYTDPMSAYSSHKPLRPLPPAPPLPPPPLGPRSSEMSRSGIHQFHDSYAPRQNFPQAGVPYYNRNPTPSGATGFRSPIPVHQGSPSWSPTPYRAPQYHNSPDPGLGHGGSPYTTHQGSPNYVQHTQGSGPWPNSSPNPSPRYEGSPSPASGSGRGRGRWDGAASPNARGQGHASYGQSRSYFNRAMVEDPWKSLTPVTWKSESSRMTSVKKKTLISDKPRADPRMTSVTKKARVSGYPKAESSLAEFLAAAADAEDGDDPGTG